MEVSMRKWITIRVKWAATTHLRYIWMLHKLTNLKICRCSTQLVILKTRQEETLPKSIRRRKLKTLQTIKKLLSPKRELSIIRTLLWATCGLILKFMETAKYRQLTPSRESTSLMRLCTANTRIKVDFS